MRLWFYVPDYPKVRDYLETAYLVTGVEELSAEPGRVYNCPDDADVTVEGGDRELARFWNLLRVSKISGLQLEGSVRWSAATHEAPARSPRPTWSARSSRSCQMRRFAVKSENLAEVGFDPLTLKLEVVFMNGPGWVYTYKHVGMIKFVKLITAPSIGKYFDKHIRSKPKMHPYTKRKE